jgi:octaprenyl-diphosphate synthase
MESTARTRSQQNRRTDDSVMGSIGRGCHDENHDVSAKVLRVSADAFDPGGRPDLAEQLKLLYGPVAKSLVDVERRLRVELQSRYESLNPLLRHGTQLGGKRLRPAMLLLSATATGSISSDHVVLGTVLEMVHTATLIHDDVLDGAGTRRHVSTVNARWDNHTSILLGDYLFAQSFHLAATLGDTQACRWVGEAARRVCEGELRQILARDMMQLSEENYIDIIRGKTAELCQVACRLGASYSGAAPEVVDALGRYGDAVGIAFQIADDYLDLWGDESSIGKTLGTDLQQGKATLPVIRMLSTSTERERRLIADVLTGPTDRRLKDLRPMLQRCDARHYTRKVAEAYRDKAVDALTYLNDSDAKRSLSTIAEFSVARQF